MLIKFTNKNGDSFLLNSDAIIEVENFIDDECKSKIYTSNFGNKFVKETVEEIYHIINK